MQYIQTAGWDDGVADLAERLVRELAAGQQVLWLVTGGSNLQASVDIMNTIPDKLSRNLSVMLADERYGDVGHADSNWAQLLQAGFSGRAARLLPVLRAGDSFEQAVAYFDKLAHQALADHQVVIAQMGIGTDGHIAGILPSSVAAQETAALVTGYDSPPYQRLTMTFPALRHITVDYSFAFGAPKRQALATLQSQSLPLDQQPAQILKELPEAYVYTDQLEEPA